MKLDKSILKALSERLMDIEARFSIDNTDIYFSIMNLGTFCKFEISEVNWNKIEGIVRQRHKEWEEMRQSDAEMSL